MAEFTSEIKTIPHSDALIYTVLSDLNNLELVRDRIPEDKIKDFTFDTDSCTMDVPPVGKVKFVIISREPNSCIKFEAEQLPVNINLWIQLKATQADETKMKLTVKADLNPFLKPMVSKPLQQGIDKIADMLATLPYNNILNQGTIEDNQ